MTFTIQWHITDRCENNCRFCYIDDSEITNSIKSELSFDEMKKVIEDYSKALTEWDAKGFIYFTGGNPLLHPNIWDLIEYSNQKGITSHILGNPSLSREDCDRMKALGIGSYQLSLDGLQEAHDYFRGEGHYNKSIESLKLLKEYDITRCVMFTLSNQNKEDLVPLLDNLISNDLTDLFAFARLVPIGKGRDYQEELIETEDYKDILLEIFEKVIDLYQKGYNYRFIEKEGELWELLYHQLGIRKNLMEDSDIIFGGCYIGNMGLTILSNGDVLPCRRLPIKIGQVPDQSIREIFLLSEGLNNLRDIRDKSSCKECVLNPTCIGCPAITYAIKEDYFKRDPNCWKILNEGD